MRGTLTVAATQKKQTKNGKPYLVVKSTTGKFFPIWEEQQAIWHLFTDGATLEVEVLDKGNIVGVSGMGEEVPRDKWGEQFTTLASRVSKLEQEMQDIIAELRPPLKDDIDVTKLPL